MTETETPAPVAGPADGSLYGWRHGAAITALIMFFDDGAPDGCPSWSVYPHAGIPGAHWPPFTDDDWGPDWFREHSAAGHLADLGPSVAATCGTIFCVPSGEALGNFLCAVRADIPVAPGFVLPRGCYAYDLVLRSGIQLPSLDDLLADESRVDLGPRFPLAA